APSCGGRSWRTPGRGTCGSCATGWSAPCSWPTASWTPPTSSPRRRPPRAPPPRRTAPSPSPPPSPRSCARPPSPPWSASRGTRARRPRRWPSRARGCTGCWRGETMCRNETVVAPRDMTKPPKSMRRCCLWAVRGLPCTPAAAAMPRTIPHPHAMRIGRFFALGLAVLSAPLLAGCDTDVTGTVPTEELVFVRQAPGSPALEAQQITFWAVKGVSQQVDLPYVNGYDCMEFKLSAASLLRRPDGTLLQNGDSVQITIRV